MKALHRNFGLFILFILFFNNSEAQKASYTTNGGLTFGFGAGMSYQKSDLSEADGLAFDFIVGSPLYKKDNAFLSVDWKFRFMAGGNKAYDHRINADNTYSNIQYSFNNYDLELGLTLNRLRERTKIVLTGFAGAGITHGRSFTDLYDAGNNLYDFSSIDPNRDRSLVYEDLVSLSDGNFETSLVNKAALLPTAGFYIGYQVSKAFSLGFEYKTNFYLTEHNSTVGLDLDNMVLSGSALDRNSYLSLGLKWMLRGASSSGSGTGASSADMRSNYINPSTPKTNNRTTVTAVVPTVKITDPTVDPYSTTAFTHTIRATVENVSGPEEISFLQNGYPNNRFSYSASNKIFTANVQLREGENSFKVKAINQVSSAEDLVIIKRVNPSEQPVPVPIPVSETDVAATDNPAVLNQVSPPADTLALPMVRFVNPAIPVTVQNNRFPLKAEALNVSGRSNVSLVLNGAGLDYFFFNAQGAISTSLLLSDGINTLEIIASNEAGTTSDRTTITYERPINRTPLTRVPSVTDGSSGSTGTPVTPVSPVSPVENPSVTYTEPAEKPAVVRDEPVETPTYTNPVVVNTSRTRKPVEETKPIEEVKPCLKPDLKLLNPLYGETNTNQKTFGLKAAAANIAYSYQLKLRLNGRDVRFSYSNKEVSSTLSLNIGINTISLTGKNECGEDVTSAKIIYAPSVVVTPTPPVVEEPKPNEEVKPCLKPDLRLLNPLYGETNTNQKTFGLKAAAANIANNNQLKLRLNGKDVRLNYSNKIVSSTLSLNIGINTISLIGKNECGEDVASAKIIYAPSVVVTPTPPPVVEVPVTPPVVVDPVIPPVVIEVIEEVIEDEEDCGFRINPGNSAWQFCMVTPSGTFTRDNLRNTNFSYSGPASSLFLMPLGGGGKVTVNGSPYSLKSGAYYLFNGTIDVSVSTKKPGSMGRWAVCVDTNKAPETGNGNKRPKSPCE